MVDKDPKLQEILRRIVEAVHPAKIYLFGSRAHGDARDDSDYDLALIYNGDKSKRDVKLAVRRAFGLTDFGMDLFVLTSYELERYRHVATTLEREITENGVIVYG